jgi:carbon storage regulator
MLVLSRHRDETIMIGDDVKVTVVDIRGDRVRLGINAPKTVSVHRKEVCDAIRRERPIISKHGLKANYTEDNPPLVGNADSNMATDEQWWDDQVKNFPIVKSVNGGWTVAVAPTNRTLSYGKTFMEAVHRCRELAARI